MRPKCGVSGSAIGRLVNICRRTNDEGQPQRAGLRVSMKTEVNLVAERKRSDHAVVSQRIQTVVIGIDIRAPVPNVERIMFAESP